jgi:hypothetical protein
MRWHIAAGAHAPVRCSIGEHGPSEEDGRKAGLQTKTPLESGGRPDPGRTRDTTGECGYEMLWDVRQGWRNGVRIDAALMRLLL